MPVSKEGLFCANCSKHVMTIVLCLFFLLETRCYAQNTLSKSRTPDHANSTNQRSLAKDKATVQMDSVKAYELAKKLVGRVPCCMISSKAAEDPFKSLRHLNHIKLQNRVQGFVRFLMTDDPIVSAKIVLVGTTFNTLSDDRGYFHLAVPDSIQSKMKDSVLIQISHDGYLTKEFKIWLIPIIKEPEQVYFHLQHDPPLVFSCCFCVPNAKKNIFRKNNNNKKSKKGKKKTKIKEDEK